MGNDLELTVTTFADKVFAEHSQHFILSKDKKFWRVDFFGVRPTKWQHMEAIITADALFEARIPNHAASFAIFSAHIYKLVKKKAEDDVYMPEEFEGCSIVTDILLGKRYVKENGGLKPYNFDIFKDQLPKDTYDVLFSQQENAIVTFNPFRDLTYEAPLETTTGVEEHTHYNLYVKPRWRFEKAKTEFPKCEKYVRPFLEHLFPLEDERKRVLCWMAGVIKHRRNDILLLVGTKGNGKGTFKDLVSAMVGNHNQMIAGSDFCKDKFNGEIAYKQFIRTDEFKVKGERKENLKKFSNDVISIERKGGDPILVENFCSFCVANNYDNSVHLDYNDRRFFVPQLSEKNLVEVWPEQSILEFRHLINTLDFQTELPYWIEQEVEKNGLEYTGNSPYRTERFYELVEKSKPKWWREFKNILKSKPEATFSGPRFSKVSELTVKEMLDLEAKEREFIERDRLTQGKEPGLYTPFEIATIRYEAGVGCTYISHIYEGEAANKDADSVNENDDLGAF